MKKYVVLLPLLLLLGTAVAQQANTTNNSKPSAAVHNGNRAHVTNSPSTPAVNELALPEGTAIRMKLETPLSSSTSKRGDRFGGRVTQAVLLNGKTIIPVGAALEGVVISAEDHHRVRGTGTLDLRPDMVTLPDGQRYAVNAVIVDTSHRPDVDVNDEGQIKGRGHDGGDLIETGALAGGGAVLGGVIGGGKGALIGAGVGATASVVHWLTKTKSANLPAGTEIVMELSRPLQLNAVDTGD